MRAALPLFLARGYHATPVRDVAEAAGVSVGTIFNCFESKDDLLESIVGEHLAMVTQALRDAERRLGRGGVTPGDLFAEVFRSYARSMMQLDRFFTLIAQEAKSLSSRRRTELRNSENRAARLLKSAARAAIGSGAFDREGIDFKVHSLIALVRFWSGPERPGDLGADGVERLADLAAAMMRSSAPQPARPASMKAASGALLLCV